MKTLTITIVKRDIYNAVAMATAYEGDKGSNLAAENVEDLYTKAFTTDADQDLLEDYFAEASGMVADAIRKHATTLTIPEQNSDVDLTDTFTATLSLPDEWKDIYANSINADVRMFFVDWICYKWLSMMDADRAKRHLDSSANSLRLAISKILIKGKPTRTVPEDVVHDDDIESDDDTTTTT